MDYKYFTFDGISSSVYNLYIINNGEDLSYPSQPSFDNNIVSPLYQGTSFLAGVNKKDRVFNFNCWVDSITRNQMIDLQNWLNIEKIADLVLDYNLNFKYRVKIASISDFKHFALNDEVNLINYEFSISFVTIGDAAATSINSYTSASGFNSDGFEIGMSTTNGTATNLYLYNYYSLPFSMNFAATGNAITIAKDGVTYYSYNNIPTATYTVNSQYGFCQFSNTALIETYAPAVYTNIGPMLIPSNIATGSVMISNATAEPTFTTFANVRYLEPTTQTVYDDETLSDIIVDLDLEDGDSAVVKYLYPTCITVPVGSTFSFNYRDKF